MTRAFPEQTRQKNGAYKQAPFPESMLKCKEFLHDIVEIPNHQLYMTVSFFFPTEIQESICPAAFELSEPLAFLLALSSILQGWIIMSLPYLNTRDL